MPTFSKPSSRALLLMELALLIVVVREAPGGAELVTLVRGIRRHAAIGRNTAVAWCPLAGANPEGQVHERRRAEDANRDVDVPRPEDAGADDRGQDDPEADVPVEVLLDVEEIGRA